LSADIAAGDVVLVAMGDRLRRSVHPGDLVGRLTLGNAERVLTVSIGVTPLSGSGGTIEALAAAGQAVYLAEERGRDRAELGDRGARAAYPELASELPPT
jgi:GGDEF domain-containing protein